MIKRVTISDVTRLSLLFDQIFFCPSCTTWRLPKRVRQSTSRPAQWSKRDASTWSSSTAINATKPVPPHLRPLYDSLFDVKKGASSHINTSRLQLALQGLESQNPTIRLAILGLNVADTARRIARLLLTDPLEDQGQWEERLASGNQDYSRGLIIRFGRDTHSGVQQPKNSVPVLSIPAGILERHNLEVLVSSVNGSVDDGPLQPARTPANTFLSPAVGTPTSSDGRQTIINQPVHKTLVVAQGLDELLAVSELLASTSFQTKEDRNSVRVAVNFQDINIPKSTDKTYIVNTRLAEEALTAIRRSITKATDYEHKWMASNMTTLSDWLQSSTSASKTPNQDLVEPVESLIKSILDTTSQNIEAARTSSYHSAAEHSLSAAEKFSIEAAVDEFSRSAHQELQSGLASAWSSRNWRKLAWYKLFWRVDDVGLIVTDLVNSAWLPKTERAVYELSGRMIQLGINPVVSSGLGTQLDSDLEESDISESSRSRQPVTLGPQLATVSASTAGNEPLSSIPPTTTATAFYSVPSEQNSSVPIITNPNGKAQIDMTPKPTPHPLTATISTTRRTYIHNSTTNLTTTAQQLVLRTLSLTGLTAGLTGLTYLSSLSLYEASTITAIGTVYALYTMQTKWLKATRSFEDGLFQTGRQTILDMTSHLRTLVQSKTQIHLDQFETRSLQRASDAVEKARMELNRVVRQK